MTIQEYKYDVAFSFLADDEELATEINNLIQDRLATFIYSEKQKELAGTDGEETFNRVFGSEARTVFILYRKGWGETSWTCIEETAIRNRAYEERYDFVLLAPLDKPPTVPKWLPKNRIWIGLERWGIEGAASVIEARVQEAGGTPREETVKDRVDRLSREIEAEKEKKAFIDSPDGVKVANEEVSLLFSELEKVVSSTGDKLNIESGRNECAIYGDGFSVYFRWSSSFSNTLDSSALYLSLWEGSVSIRSGRRCFPFEEPKRLKEMEFQFDLSKSRKPTWKDTRGTKQSYSTADLAKLSLTMLLNTILESKRKER
ncbi:MAG: hypothetical protein AB1488_07940 [Nitrospirota bacterium]